MEATRVLWLLDLFNVFRWETAAADLKQRNGRLEKKPECGARAAPLGNALRMLLAAATASDLG